MSQDQEVVIATLSQSVAIPVGSIKQFGEWGPIYEVLGTAPRGPKGEMIAIRVVHSGETLDYPLADALEDPWTP